MLAALCNSVSAGDEWKEMKGKHFIVHYRSDRDFADKVRSKAEKEYQRIVKDLGYTKYGDFWLWDDRVKIYLYSSRQEFISAENAPEWAAGKADYKDGLISGIEANDIFLNSVLSHELGHLVFRDFVGFTDEVPLWLDEGVAQWEDYTTRERARVYASKMFKENRLFNLNSLTSMDVRMVNEAGAAPQFYAQSVSLVGFMIEEHGAERFTRFCRKLKDGRSMDEALRFTYPEGMRTIQELEVQWQESMSGEQ